MFVAPWLSEVAGQGELFVARAELVEEAADVRLSEPVDVKQESSPTTPPDPLRASPQPMKTPDYLAAPARQELSLAGIGTQGGGFSDYDLPAGMTGPGPQFFGLGGKARGSRGIVYVVDRSGSMTDTFAFVQEELKKSIRELRRHQSFHIIFFSDTEEPVELPPGRLTRAGEDRKRAAFEFIDSMTPGGGTQPANAMRRALMLRPKPDLVYFLTDGLFDPVLVDQLEEWNADRDVKIFTIGYFNRQSEPLLSGIARRHGGEYRFVGENDLP